MITIVIAEDQEMLLGVIGSLLNLEEDMTVVGQAKNGKEALTLAHQLKPDVCIMDIEMPTMNGLDAAEALMASECKVIILTTFARKGYFERARKAGVNGYLLKDSPSEELAGSIRKILDGNQIYSPELMDAGSNDYNREMKRLEVVVEHSVLKESFHKKSNSIGAIRNNLLTIMDKMKSPTG